MKEKVNNRNIYAPRSTTAVKRELHIYTEFQISVSQSQNVNIINKESCCNNNNNNHNADKTNNNK